MKSLCHDLPLEQILTDNCDPVTESEIQAHLETCTSCQQRLSSIAAEPGLWDSASRNLKTLPAIRVDDRLQEKFNQSSSFLVANHADALVEHSATRFGDWKQILDPPKHPEMLGQIDEFEVSGKIGQGGMGIVLKGHDRELDRAVAIKVLSPHLASNGTARKRFAREAQAAAAVVHPSVVPIYSVKQSVDRPYIVMQLVSGRSLQTVVEDDGPLSAQEVVRVAMQIADGLAAAHEQGLIHRDVKPANVLTERDVTRVMITDFGLARAVDDVGMTQTGWLAGTPHYMSPEQSRGDDLDGRSDLFSLGSLMYFLATGREPFRAERSYGVIQQIINEQPTEPRQLNAEIPATLSSIISKLLEKEPAHRFESASELSLYLKEYLAHLRQPNQVQPPVKLDPPLKPGLRQPAWVNLVVFATLILFLPTAGYFAWSAWNNAQPQQPSSTKVADTVPNSAVPAEMPMFNFDDPAYFKEISAADAEMSRLESEFGIGTASSNRFDLSPDTKPALKLDKNIKPTTDQLRQQN